LHQPIRKCLGQPTDFDSFKSFVYKNKTSHILIFKNLNHLLADFISTELTRISATIIIITKHDDNEQMKIACTQIHFLILMLLMCCAQAFAQPDFNLLNTSDSEDTGYQQPEINKLPTNWWSKSIEAAPAEEPYLYLQQWSEELLSRAQADSTTLSNDDRQAIRQFNINITNLTQSSEISETSAPENYQQNDQYELAEVIELMQKLRQKQQQLENEKSTVTVLQGDVEQERNTIDRLIIAYQQYNSDQSERFSIAYQWLESRSWVALYEAQIAQFDAKISQTQYQIDLLTNYISDSKAKLQPQSDDIDDLNKQININQNALTKAQQEALNSSLNLAKTSDSLNSNTVDYEKLNLAQSLIAQKRLELAIARDTLHKHWIVNNTDTAEDLSIPTEQLILETDQLISETSERINHWRTLAQDYLLSSVGVNNTSSGVTAQRTAFSQEVLLKLDGLDWQVEKVSFIKSLLIDYSEEPEGGFDGFIQSISDFSAAISSGFSAVMNKPLFRINETPVTLLPLLRLLIIVLIGYLVSKLVRVIIKRMESRRGNDKSPVFFMLDKLIHYIIIFVAALAGFTTLGIDFSNLTLIAGALSVGIGFGLQNIVSNFVSGLTIMFERTLKVGDYIEIEDGFTGTVKEINARSTRINTNDNIDVVIPNSDLVTNQIINWTLRDSIKRVKIPFGVAYGSDKDLVKKAAQEAAENVPYTLTNMNGKEPEVWMTGFGDNSLDFILLIWVSKYGVRRPNRIKAAYLWELDTAFNKYGIEIPFPQRVLHHANDDADEDVEESS
jgi:potassium efflux system protein